jgi:hypothetical protein
MHPGTLYTGETVHRYIASQVFSFLAILVIIFYCYLSAYCTLG